MKKGVLVLGHPRSGTTLLRRLLDAHPELAAPPETHLFRSASRFLYADETSHGLDMGVLTGLQFAGFEPSSVLASLRKYVFGFLEQFAESQGKSRWVEKTAFDIFHINEIEQVCQDEVYYIGIIRHPLNVALSCKEFCDKMGVYPDEMHEYIKKYPQPTEAFIQSWLSTTKKLFELGEKYPDSCIILCYEDLIEDPVGILSELLEFIGEKPHEHIGTLAGKKQLGFSDHKAYESNKVLSDTSHDWASIPTNQFSRFAEILNETLVTCGYEPINTSGKYSKEEARRFYLMGQMKALSNGEK